MKRKKMRKVLVYLLMVSFCITSLIPVSGVNACTTSSKFNYKDALKDSLLFYDAQRCGKDVDENNAFNCEGLSYYRWTT
jgi:hypothetical protein